MRIQSFEWDIDIHRVAPTKKPLTVDGFHVLKDWLEHLLGEKSNREVVITFKGVRFLSQERTGEGFDKVFGGGDTRHYFSGKLDRKEDGPLQ